MPASSEDLNALAEKLLALELEKEAEGEVIQDTLRLLEGSLEINDLQTLQKALDAIGTLCRDKNNRELVGKQPGLIAAIGSIFTKDLEATEENGKLIALAARAFGNLAFDNEENVDQIIPIFPPELVVSLLTRFNFSDALCNIASTIGNIVTVSEDSSYQVRLVQAGALPLVINLLKHESFEVQTKAVRAINNLAEGDANKAVLVQIGILKDLQNIVLNHNTPKGLRVEATEVLTSLFEKNPVALQQIIEDREVDRLLDIGLQSGNEGDGTSVDTHAFDLLVLYVGSEDKLRALFDASKVDSLLRRLDAPNRALASQVIRLLGHLALNDAIMPRIGLGHQHYVNALKSENGIDQLYGAMAIGNSARTEDICKQYMQDGAVPLLIGVCLDKDTEERARHLSASALRNIGITVEHRPLITQHEHCFEALIQILETNNAVVLFASVLAIKVLVTANPQGADAFFATPEAVEKLVQMFDRYMDEGQRRVQFETARIFPVLASYKDEYRTLLAQKGGAAALQSLVTSTFAILQIEGLKELLIWAEDNDLQRLIQKEEGLVEGIIKSMGSGSSDVRELAAKLVHKLFGDHGLSLGELLDNHATLVLAIDKNL